MTACGWPASLAEEMCAPSITAQQSAAEQTTQCLLLPAGVASAQQAKQAPRPAEHVRAAHLAQRWLHSVRSVPKERQGGADQAAYPATGAQV